MRDAGGVGDEGDGAGVAGSARPLLFNPAAAAPPPSLARTLGAWSAGAIVVSSVVGSGIYRVPASVAADAGSPAATLALWILGGAIALAGALSLAELAVRFPRAGGMYVVLRETYGRLAAFLFGWGMLVVNPAGYAAVGLIFAASLRSVFGFAAHYDRLVAAAMIAGLVAVNVRPVRFGAAVQNASTITKLAGLVGLSIAAIVLGDGALGAFGVGGVGMEGSGAAGEAAARAAQEGAARGATGAAPSLHAIGIALVAVLFAYDGWQWTPQVAGELRDPRHALPRALGGGVFVITGVYLLANVANLWVLPMEDLAASSLVTADVARRVAGEAAVPFVAALVALSTLSGNHGGFTTDPRVFYAMAEDGLFFRSVARVHPRHHTPDVAVLVTGLVAVIYVFIRPFERLAETLILGMWPFLGMAVAAIFIHRYKDGRRDAGVSEGDAGEIATARVNEGGSGDIASSGRHFSVPGYPITPMFFLAACAALIGSALVQQPATTLANFAALAAGIPVYFAWTAWRRRRDAAGD